MAALLVACSGDEKTEADEALEALNRGLEAHVAGDLDGAAAEYQDVLEIDPRNSFAIYNLGLIDQTRGNFQSAETRYRLALSITPDFTAALFNLAIIRTELGDREEAISLYRQVIAVDPNHATGHLEPGVPAGGRRSVRSGECVFLSRR